MSVLFKCFENKHYPNIKEYVSQFGNINRDGLLYRYCSPGIDLSHWREISFQEFIVSARPEAIDLINFISLHKRLPNYIR